YNIILLLSDTFDPGVVLSRALADQQMANACTLFFLQAILPFNNNPIIQSLPGSVQVNAREYAGAQKENQFKNPYWNESICEKRNDSFQVENQQNFKAGDEEFYREGKENIHPPENGSLPICQQH